MPLNEAGCLHLSKILVAEIAMADTFCGAVAAEIEKKQCSYIEVID